MLLQAKELWLEIIQEDAEAIREGEIGLAESIRSGRQFGITGLRDTETSPNLKWEEEKNSNSVDWKVESALDKT